MVTSQQKQSALLPSVSLQEHQQRIADMAGDRPLRMLLVHALGSGKSLSGIAAAEARNKPYVAVAPASLRQNYQKELAKFTDRQQPADVLSYTAVGQGADPGPVESVIADEAHRLRNPDAAQTKRMIELTDKAKQVLLLSGSPMVNRPGDLAVPLRILTGEKMTPDEFEERYTTQKPIYSSILHRLFGMSRGTEPAVKNEKELRQKLQGHVSYYDPGKPVVPTTYEDVHVDMSPRQAMVYQGIWKDLPWWARLKLQREVDLTPAELKRTIAFLTGPRQAGLSTHTFAKSRGPLHAFDDSPKLQQATKHLEKKLNDPQAKALVFSNYIDAGLIPYAAGLARKNIPHAVFHGGLSDADRKKLVDDYNTGKIRVALIGPSGTEGLSFKGTQLVQLLDPHYAEQRGRQAVGRGLRFDSHEGLPEELRNVHVQRFYSRLPLGLWDKFLSTIGMDRTAHALAADDHLRTMAARKEKKMQSLMRVLQEVGAAE